MFDRILVPLDGSSVAESALPHAAVLARVFGASVTFLHVLDSSQLSAPSGLIDPLQWHVDRSEASAYVDSVAARFRAAGLDAQATLREGRTPLTIVEHADSADLIVLGTHGQSGSTEWGMGSVAQKVLSLADCSVLLVRAGPPWDESLETCRYKRMLIPLDGSLRAEAVLPPAAALARACDAQILVTHVVANPEMPRRLPPSEDEMSLTQQFMAYNTEAADAYLKQVLYRLPWQPESRLLQGGNVVAMLHQLVESERIDLVTLCAHGYTGNASWRFGSVANSFITYGTTALLILQDMPVSRAASTQDAPMRSHEIPMHGFGR